MCCGALEQAGGAGSELTNHAECRPATALGIEHQRSNDDEQRAAAQANALRLDGSFLFSLRRDGLQPLTAQQSRPQGDSAESPHGLAWRLKPGQRLELALQMALLR